MGGRFVLSLKDVGSGREKPEARFVAQGNRDKGKPYMVHGIASLCAPSIRLILSDALIKGFRVFSHDNNQAYLQIKDPVSRRIQFLPKKEDLEILGVSDKDLLQLIQPLYGICDAGDYWGITVPSHIEDDLDMVLSLGDPYVYLKISDWKLEGIMEIYVDDNLNAGTKGFDKFSAENLRKFDCKPRV